MAEIYETAEQKERVVLVAVETQENEGLVEDYLDELEELVETRKFDTCYFKKSLKVSL